MDSATPLEPAPTAGGDAAIGGARVWKLANDGPGAGGGIALAGQACPVSQGSGDTHPLFPGENRASVAVATPGTMVKFGITKSVEVLLQPGPMLLFRLLGKSKSRKVRFPQLGSRRWRQVPPISRERTRRRRHLKNGWCRTRQLTVVAIPGENWSENRENDRKKIRKNGGVHQTHPINIRLLGSGYKSFTERTDRHQGQRIFLDKLPRATDNLPHVTTSAHRISASRLPRHRPRQ